VAVPVTMRIPASTAVVVPIVLLCGLCCNSPARANEIVPSGDAQLTYGEMVLGLFGAAIADALSESDTPVAADPEPAAPLVGSRSLVGVSYSLPRLPDTGSAPAAARLDVPKVDAAHDPHLGVASPLDESVAGIDEINPDGFSTPNSR
jgi:hypothetical protein